MMLFEVYDPHGEMFEVTPAKAKELVIMHGWSMTKGQATGMPTQTAPAQMPVFINRAAPEPISPTEPHEPAEPLTETPTTDIPVKEPEPAHAPMTPVHEPETVKEPVNVQTDEIHPAPPEPPPVAANLRPV